MARAIQLTGSPAYRSDEVIAVPRSPLYKAYRSMHWGLMAVPLLAGLDKFANLTTQWSDYLAPQIGSLVVAHTPFTTHELMMGVGAVEILAALLVAVRPRIGATVVGLWLGAVIVNLLIGMHYFDIALRDFGLMVAAFGLAWLGRHFDRAHEPRVRADEDVLPEEEHLRAEDMRPKTSPETSPATHQETWRSEVGSAGRFWRHRADDMI